jgi:F0F1-type ATP synthase membrane subunit b/b'
MKKFLYLYIDGFKNMKTGKLLWKIIAFKFIVFILIMKVFFFPNFLKTNFTTDEERSSHVLENLTKGL